MMAFRDPFFPTAIVVVVNEGNEGNEGGVADGNLTGLSESIPESRA